MKALLQGVRNLIMPRQNCVVDMLRCITVLVLVSGCYTSRRSLPSDFPRCNRNDPNLEACLLKYTELLRPRAINGIKQLGLPSFNPFVLPQFSLSQNSGLIKYGIQLRNVVIHGLEDYKFERLDYEPEKYLLRGAVTFEKAYVRANYDLDGSIFDTRLQGKGVVKTISGPINVNFTFGGQLKEVNGKEYVKPGTANIKLSIPTIEGRFDGLINDNEQLSKTTNRILNENSNSLLREACPQIQTAIGEIALQVWDRTIGAIPYDDLLPVSN